MVNILSGRFLTAIVKLADVGG